MVSDACFCIIIFLTHGIGKCFLQLPFLILVSSRATLRKLRAENMFETWVS